MEKPSITQRPAAAAAGEPKKRKIKCTHKYELAEYPGVRTKGYLFYCIFCLDFQEKIYP